MNGQTMCFEKYEQYLETMEMPIMPSSLPKRKINFTILVKYAKENKIDIASLSLAEKEHLIELSGANNNI